MMRQALTTALPSLVFLEQKGLNSEPYTTSKVVAEGTGIEHRKLKSTIRKHITALESLGIIAPYEADIRRRGQPEKVYHLNEQQATLLVTLLKNTPVVVAFKTELVRQFYTMRVELAKRKQLRIEGKPIHRSLTDVLRDSGEADRMHGHGYEAYTNLAYQLATGKRAAQLRRERSAPKTAVAADFLTSEELAAYQKQEAALAALVDAGLCYQQIKATLTGKNVGQK